MISKPPRRRRLSRSAQQKPTQISKPVSLCSKQRNTSKIKRRSILCSKSTTSPDPKPSSPPSSASSQYRKFSVKSWYDPKRYQKGILDDLIFDKNENKNRNDSRVCLNTMFFFDDLSPLSCSLSF